MKQVTLSGGETKGLASKYQ